MISGAEYENAVLRGILSRGPIGIFHLSQSLEYFSEDVNRAVTLLIGAGLVERDDLGDDRDIYGTAVLLTADGVAVALDLPADVGSGQYIDDPSLVHALLRRYARAVAELVKARQLVDLINDDRLHPDSGDYSLLHIGRVDGLEIYAEQCASHANWDPSDYPAAD